MRPCRRRKRLGAAARFTASSRARTATSSTMCSTVTGTRATLRPITQSSSRRAATARRCGWRSRTAPTSPASRRRTADRRRLPGPGRGARAYAAADPGLASPGSKSPAHTPEARVRTVTFKDRRPDSRPPSSPGSKYHFDPPSLTRRSPAVGEIAKAAPNPI